MLFQEQKWSTTEGREALYDLSQDPGEQNNLLVEDSEDRGAAYRGHLSDALGKEVAVGYRLTTARARADDVAPTWALCTVPGGFKASWLGGDPLKNGAATVKLHPDSKTAAELLKLYQIYGHEVPADVGQTVEICWQAGQKGSREVYVVPNRPLAEVGHDMRCSAYQGDETGGKRATLAVNPHRYPAPDAIRTPLDKANFEGRRLPAPVRHRPHQRPERRGPQDAR